MFITVTRVVFLHLFRMGNMLVCACQADRCEQHGSCSVFQSACCYAARTQFAIAIHTSAMIACCRCILLPFAHTQPNLGHNLQRALPVDCTSSLDYAQLVLINLIKTTLRSSSRSTHLAGRAVPQLNHPRHFDNSAHKQRRQKARQTVANCSASSALWAQAKARDAFSTGALLLQIL